MTRPPGPNPTPSAPPLPEDGFALVIGASGGIGGALAASLEASGRYAGVIRLSRRSTPGLDLLDETSVAKALEAAVPAGEVRLAIHAAGVLHGPGLAPEKSLSAIDPAAMARAFAINATGPALVMKHLLPRLPRRGRCVLGVLSARVGSIGDNRLGGWYAYRASKAALNQLVRTAAVEFSRRNPDSVCVALHPGTVATGLSAPFRTQGPGVQTPQTAAAKLLSVLEALPREASGGFFDMEGKAVPW